MITVQKLFLKESLGNTLREVDSFEVTKKGIVGAKVALPQRHILILTTEIIERFDLEPGDLKENIIIDGLDIHALSSGTVIQIGEVQIRLTYHCEPCKQIKDVVALKKIEHQRGYLGTVLNKGEIKIGDTLTVLDITYDSIPYTIKDRIMWYLDQQKNPVSIKKLAYEISVSPSYYRAIPNMLKKMDPKYMDLVNYPSKNKQPSLFD
ncbi:MOSC domain-containing protein [Aquimarina muelleri]|uniref:MOSC domain-containing protein n=1 Tax=Aquimarina muelleri TaxID=279356 RepID=A0A918JRQ1_9FLAO|nr:MOSC domain-containing protein [Aquimarina muelleri]MCX2762033.1 MOSC domain-containing protein [Aquimarina muelleri]GGX03957.1 hypothetical protein GCM10007384_02160 [Aquimarina muelleri]